MDLPTELFKLNLVTLYVDGNKISNISEDIGQISNLRNLKLNNNKNIASVPTTIEKLVKLTDVDLRNNTIKSLPKEIAKLKTTLKYVYLHHNPICTNGWLDTNVGIQEMIENSPGAGCTAQCSMYCQDRVLGNDYCGRECNFEGCKFDNGDCL